jgi:hypothetical protein
MIMFALIGLSLILVGIVGLQFTYLFYVGRIYGERRKYLQSLEQRHARLIEQLKAAEKHIAEQDKLLERLNPELVADDEAWADVIEEL